MPQIQARQSKTTAKSRLPIIWMVLTVVFVAVFTATLCIVIGFGEDPDNNPFGNMRYPVDGVSVKLQEEDYYDDSSISKFDGKTIDSYAEYKRLLPDDDHWQEDFFDQQQLWLVAFFDSSCSESEVKLTGVTDHKAQITIYTSCGLCAGTVEVFAMPIDRNVEISSYQQKEKTRERCDPNVSDKPIIYLYPTVTTNVTVRLGSPEKIRVSYPQYQDAWRVVAQPNGDLTDLDTGRQLYALYYETDTTFLTGMHDTGFIVKGSDTAAFLEKKLAELGLNARETEEFIVYWLPKMQDNPYNYIYFDTIALLENMPIDVTPRPDTAIRFNMEYKALDHAIELPAQQLPATPERKGFTMVEWGGSEL